MEVGEAWLKWIGWVINLFGGGIYRRFFLAQIVDNLFKKDSSGRWGVVTTSNFGRINGLGRRTRSK